ncbi:pentatricopeptide repeat-containing protein At4g32430, mitochondrial-like [Coffea arabica]|uniref:Pentatricopeptide repeat-containing protein At4g32430, mitochondrial-like n=1 Tax=Coffea arabica TaxID=13443 RepID=A0A6P6SL43_COFAR
MITGQLKFKSLCAKLPQLAAFKTLHSFNYEHQLFDETPSPQPASLHHTMLNHVHCRHPFEALKAFKKQLQLGISEIDEAAVAIALKACRGDPEIGTQFHGFAITSGFIDHVSVSNSLMNVYCKSGQFDRALCVFNRLESPDTVSYNTLLSGAQNGEDALSFACHLHSAGVLFDAVSFTTILAHCTDIEDFHFGSQLHSLVSKFGMRSEVYVGNALVTMYSKWGRITEAERAFCEIPNKDLVSWNAMLSGYVQEGSHGLEAIFGFVQMVRVGLKADHVSFTSVISACGQERNVEFGRQVHGLIIKRIFGTHVSVCNVLISMYSKGEGDFVEDAKLVFSKMVERNVISWTTMLSMDEEDAMNLFNKMRRDGVYPNDVTFVGLLPTLTKNDMVQEGQMVHGFCIKANFLSRLNVANCFVTMYAKFARIVGSVKVFEELDYRDNVSWNALISGYAQNELYQEAFQTFLLASAELRPNEYTFGSILNAIGSSESISLRYGQWCHTYLLKLGLNFDPVISGALLDMYAKRGSICESMKVFYESGQRSQVAWTAIISAHSRHGDYESVMSLFNEMEKKGVKPDSITFLSVLTACGRKGMVDAGMQIFNSMIKDHLIEPSSEHYSCIIDMLGRAGRLKEAEELVAQIPGGPGLSVLQSLLGACRIYGNVDLATRVADTLIQMEPEESGSYVLMSNLFAERGLWEKVAKIRKGMRDKGVKKEIGFSWVDAGSVDDSFNLHGFSSDDKSHPQSEAIYRMAEWLGSEMKYLEKEKESCDVLLDSSTIAIL